MQVSVTGATGFIGRRLVRYYEDRGATVHILSRRNIQLTNRGKIFQYDLASCDASDLVSFVEASDIVYHCAAELNDESRMWQVNVEGTRKLLDVAAGRAGRFVHLSSTGVYGAQSNGIVDESAQINPQNPYEKSKAEADRQVLEFAKAGKLSCCLLRPSNVYGSDMSNQSLFQLISMINRGRFFFIGRAGAIMNYIHVDNVLEALICCGTARLPENGAAYIVSDYCTLERLVAIISAALGKPEPRFRLSESLVRAGVALAENLSNIPLTQSRVDALTGRAVYSSEHIQHELGYRHQITLEQGFEELVTKWIELSDKPNFAGVD